jgi:hypothetical protein
VKLEGAGKGQEYYAASSRKSPSKTFLDAVGRAIVDLSVHPAGCDDWRFYEQLCLKVADNLNTAHQEWKESNND